MFARSAMIHNIVFVLVVLNLVAGCGRRECKLYPVEPLFGEKYKYSYIQNYSDFKYKDIDNHQPYLIATHDKYPPLVAFPIKGKQKGYVVILSQAEEMDTDKVKVAWSTDNFELTRAIYEEIKMQVTLSPEVDIFIASHINDGD